jgi:uncharacterized repeat protein (TIGR03803 family)
MSKLSLWRTIFLLCVFCAVEAIGSPAQTLTTLHRFDYTDGAYPGYFGPAGLVQGTNGDFYGTTHDGGTGTQGCVGCGTVFKITSGGTLTTLYSFCSQTNCADGSSPYAGLVQATNGNFYGTTPYGGAEGVEGDGTVFKITPGGTLTTLHSFNGYPTDGSHPWAGLIQATDGNFYGTTQNGGANLFEGSGAGTVFKITSSGKLTMLYSFCSQAGCTDGRWPRAGLVQATDGNFYGTTCFGGAKGVGTVFKITPGGTLTTLQSFDTVDGSYPAGLVQATDGNFYGTTHEGGTNGYGTVFKITPGGTLTTLHSFCALADCPDRADGYDPNAGLVQATNGNFYGTTSGGGAASYGTVFEITAGGKLTTLHSFDAFADGWIPFGGLVQATNGNFYGTTTYGGVDEEGCKTYGTSGCGTVFSLAVELGPFVETRPTSGNVGAAVIILGNDLKTAASVTFNGTSAAFTVVSSTEIKTTVPEGATTGRVKLKTPCGTLTSNVNFRVP